MIEIAKNYGVGPTKRKQIAEAQGITEAYLENILTALRSNGYLKTIRGSEGGFVLLKAPSEITLMELVAILEPNYIPVDCIENASACDRSGHCAARSAWKKMYLAQKQVLESITLEELALNERNAGAIDFSI